MRFLFSSVHKMLLLWYTVYILTQEVTLYGAIL